MQVRQIAGMRGLVANPRGEIIPRPIKSNFREGLSVLEYFISTHGARKGLADTALRTADSGYLTRRLVDVAQELIVREIACDTVRGIWVEDVLPGTESWRLLETSLLGRCLAEDVTLADGTVIPRNTEVNDDCHAPARRRPGHHPLCGCVRCSRARRCRVCARAATAACSPPARSPTSARRSASSPPSRSVSRVRSSPCVRSTPVVLPVRTSRTVCRVWSSCSRPVRPKSASLMADVSGVVRLGENEKGEKVITVVADDGTEFEYAVSRRAHLGVRDGQDVQAGDRLIGDEKSPLDPKKLLEIKGVRETQQYLVDEVQRVYRDQGVSIHDKHIEVIVRQMLRRVTVSEPGDSAFLPGEKVDARRYAEENRQLVESNQRPAEGRPELMGITKASLATDSWLSAASFQETTRVLTEAAIEGRSDGLEGLKENVIIGKLIPAGTGMALYRDIKTVAPDYEPLPFYTSEAEEEMDLATWLREASTPRETRARLRDPRRRPGNGDAEGPVAVDEALRKHGQPAEAEASSPTRSTRSRTSTSVTAPKPRRPARRSHRRRIAICANRRGRVVSRATVDAGWSLPRRARRSDILSSSRPRARPPRYDRGGVTRCSGAVVSRLVAHRVDLAPRTGAAVLGERRARRRCRPQFPAGSRSVRRDELDAWFRASTRSCSTRCKRAVGPPGVDVVEGRPHGRRDRAPSGAGSRGAPLGRADPPPAAPTRCRTKIAEDGVDEFFWIARQFRGPEPIAFHATDTGATFAAGRGHARRHGVGAGIGPRAVALRARVTADESRSKATAPHSTPFLSRSATRGAGEQVQEVRHPLRVRELRVARPTRRSGAARASAVTASPARFERAEIPLDRPVLHTGSERSRRARVLRRARAASSSGTHPCRTCRTRRRGTKSPLVDDRVEDRRRTACRRARARARARRPRRRDPRCP